MRSAFPADWLWPSLGLAALALVASAQAGCRRAPPAAEPKRQLVVLAAASLGAAFDEMATAYEASHPNVEVVLSFGPSSGLATQIKEGAAADVFAPASPRWMEAVAKEPGTLAVDVLARNRLAVIAPAGTSRPTSLMGLAEPGVRVVLAAEGVPAGDYARDLLQRAGILDGVLANVVSNEEDVKGVVQKVAAEEADAGIAYQTDVTGTMATRLRTIPVPDAVNVQAVYLVAVLRGAREPALARAFVAYATGPGQAVLAKWGFLPRQVGTRP